MAREGLQVALIASTVAIMGAVLLCWASMATTSTGQARAETGASDSQIPWLQKLDPWSAMKSNTVSGGVGEQVRCQSIAGCEKRVRMRVAKQRIAPTTSFYTMKWRKRPMLGVAGGSFLAPGAQA